MKLAPHFKLEEFASPGADYFPIPVINNLWELAQNLESLRFYIGEAIHVNSGWRTTVHNAAVGGGMRSQHLKGKAADIWTKGLSPEELYKKIEYLIRIEVIKEGGLGLYDTFVHYDIRGTKARWDYRKQ